MILSNYNRGEDMNKFLSVMGKRCFFVLFVFLILLIIASGNEKDTVITYNMNSTKSLSAVHIVTKYNLEEEVITPYYATTFEEVIQYAKTQPVVFNGTMTGYGPDCVGCGGKVGCPPRQDVRNGNIYYEDVEYGQVRIVATDSRIPCGTMIKISNVTFSNEPFYAIALDRGGAIKGTLMDLLLPSEADTIYGVGRQKNVVYEIVRWGW